LRHRASALARARGIQDARPPRPLALRALPPRRPLRHALGRGDVLPRRVGPRARWRAAQRRPGAARDRAQGGGRRAARGLPAVAERGLPMSRAGFALAVYVAFLAVAFGWRSWLQYRRTGDFGFRGFSRDPVERLSSSLFVLGLAAGFVAPLAELLDWLPA